MRGAATPRQGRPAGGAARGRSGGCCARRRRWAPGSRTRGGGRHACRRPQRPATQRLAASQRAPSTAARRRFWAPPAASSWVYLGFRLQGFVPGHHLAPPWAQGPFWAEGSTGRAGAAPRLLDQGDDAVRHHAPQHGRVDLQAGGGPHAQQRRQAGLHLRALPGSAAAAAAQTPRRQTPVALDPAFDLAGGRADKGLRSVALPLLFFFFFFLGGPSAAAAAARAGGARRCCGAGQQRQTAGGGRPGARHGGLHNDVVAPCIKRRGHEHLRRAREENN